MRYFDIHFVQGRDQGYSVYVAAPDDQTPDSILGYAEKHDLLFPEQGGVCDSVEEIDAAEYEDMSGCDPKVLSVDRLTNGNKYVLSSLTGYIIVEGKDTSFDVARAVNFTTALKDCENLVALANSVKKLVKQLESYNKAFEKVAKEKPTAMQWPLLSSEHAAAVALLKEIKPLL
jgi:hypothetical protein